MFYRQFRCIGCVLLLVWDFLLCMCGVCSRCELYCSVVPGGDVRFFDGFVGPVVVYVDYVFCKMYCLFVSCVAVCVY